MAKAKRYWSCRGCGTRNERTKQKCAGIGCNRSRPKPHVPAHAKTLRDDSYERYNELNALIHGITDESCAVCGKPRGQETHHDRDHGHDRKENSYGRPRGLACAGNWGCNKVMSRVSLERAKQIVAYLQRVHDYYATVDEEQEREAA